MLRPECVRHADLAAGLRVPGGGHLYRRLGTRLRAGEPHRRVGDRRGGRGLAFPPAIRGAAGKFRRTCLARQSGRQRRGGRREPGPAARFRPGYPDLLRMEAYAGSQAPAAMIFFSSWTRELHALRYRSGIYSISLSGISDLVNNYANPASTMPDVVYDALWNGSADTRDAVIPATSWPSHRRVHQYSGSVTQTFGGVSMDLDQDYLDVQLGQAGGTAQASQAVADQSSGVVNTFFRGSDGALWHDWSAPGAGWHGPTSFGGSLASEPSVVSAVPQSVAVFYQGTDGNLWSAVYTPGSGWSARRSLGMGPLGGKPVAGAQADRGIDVFLAGSGDSSR